MVTHPIPEFVNARSGVLFQSYISPHIIPRFFPPAGCSYEKGSTRVTWSSKQIDEHATARIVCKSARKSFLTGPSVDCQPLGRLIAFLQSWPLDYPTHHHISLEQIWFKTRSSIVVILQLAGPRCYDTVWSFSDAAALPPSMRPEQLHSGQRL